MHVAQITAASGPMPLPAVRASSVRSWTVELETAGLADSYVYALHSRLSQVMSDAVPDGLLARNPCSRRTSPGAGGQRPYVATTEQVWALHDAVADHLRPAVLLGGFGTAATRRRRTPTSTCGPTATSPHPPPWAQCWQLVGTRWGLEWADLRHHRRSAH